MNKLFSPPEYWQLTQEAKDRICNGMGAKDSALAKLIPNKRYGLDVTEAGNIHDYMYHVGLDLADKEEADRVFLNNLIRIINKQGGWLAFFRRRRALKYYEAVHHFGGPAFWANKNSLQELTA